MTLASLLDRRQTIRLRLRSDLAAYARTCLRIRPETGGAVPFVFNRPQRLIHSRLEEQKARTGRVRALVLKGRKMGASTYIGARQFHNTTFRFGCSSLVAAHDQDSTAELFDMPRRFYEMFPDDRLWLRPEATRARASELYFPGLDSGYKVATAGGTNIGRGRTPQNLHGSEVAFWQNADEHMRGLMQAVPEADGTEIVFESTANGIGGWFHDEVKAALVGDSGFILIFTGWYEDERYSVPIERIPEDWRPTTYWREYQKSHRLTVEQLYWAWNKNRTLARASGGVTEEACWSFKQEFPATVEEAFQTGDQRSFIPSEDVAKARKGVQLPDVGPVIFGIDVGHSLKSDPSFIIDRQSATAGKRVFREIKTPNPMELAGEISAEIRKWNPAVVNIDTTEGAGKAVHYRLVEMGYDMCRAVNFGSKPVGVGPDGDNYYANRRAEMWDSMRAWFGGELYDEVACPDDDVLHGDACMPIWGPGATRRDSERILHLEPKEKIRERLKRSPDRGDALALTFADADPPTQEAQAYEPTDHADGGMDDYNPLDW